MPKKNKELELKRIYLANKRVEKALNLIGTDLNGYPVKNFELAFLTAKFGQKQITQRQRKRIIIKILTGKAHPKYNNFIDRLEHFAKAINEINKKYL